MKAETFRLSASNNVPMQKPCSRTGPGRGPGAADRRIAALQASLARAIGRESRALARHLLYAIEALATRRDIELLRDEIRELRRPR